jgi:hypothetical protein
MITQVVSPGETPLAAWNFADEEPAAAMNCVPVATKMLNPDKLLQTWNLLIILMSQSALEFAFWWRLVVRGHIIGPPFESEDVTVGVIVALLDGRRHRRVVIVVVRVRVALITVVFCVAFGI